MSMFMAYAKHEQEKENIIKTIVEQARMGNMNFSLNVDDDFSEQELKEIQEEAMRRLR